MFIIGVCRFVHLFLCDAATKTPPCSYNKTNEMHQFLRFIFGIELCMFRTVSLSIIRSLALYTQQYIQVMLTAC
jgi:hypothetical protein